MKIAREKKTRRNQKCSPSRVSIFELENGPTEYATVKTFTRMLFGGKTHVKINLGQNEHI
jgi:hypothetical protein